MNKVFTILGTFSVLCLSVLGAGHPGQQNSADVAKESEAPSDTVEAFPFLSDLPELKGFTLGMSEKTFEKLLGERGLRFDRAAMKDDPSFHTYIVSIPRKEWIANVIFGFKDGVCSGVQRQPPSPKADPAKGLGVPERILDAAIKYVSTFWPDVDLQTWHPAVHFSKDAEAASLFKTPHWTFSFDGPPPVHGPDLLPMKLEYTGQWVSYSLTLDEKENVILSTVIQQ